MPEGTRYRFGPFLLEPAIRQLTRGATSITLPPKAFDILVLLLRSRDRVVTKQQLLDEVWSDTAVTENTLTQRIKEVRDALGDVAQEPQWVRTVSRVGYHFVGEVLEEAWGEEVSAKETDAPKSRGERKAVEAGFTPVVADRSGPDRSSRHWRRGVYAAVIMLTAAAGFALWSRAAVQPPVAEKQVESIAVLPLVNLSGDPEQEYFADGMTDELIARLAQIPAFRVISRTSALRYKSTTKSVREIGRELNVDAVVEGSVLRVGSQARITLKLIEAATDRTLLAESYARELDDILALQSQIARALAERVRVTVTSRDEARLIRRVMPQAYDEYLRGRAMWSTRTRDGVTRALELFHRAIERDPTFAAAWAGVADCYIVFSGALLGLSEKEAYPKARDAALRALALDETLAEAHTSLGSVKSEFDWDWAGAEAEYTRAIALNSSYVTARQWYGEFLWFHGRNEESLMQLRRARDLDPLSPVVNNSLALSLLAAHRSAEALTQAQRTLELDPEFGGAHLSLGAIYLDEGMPDKAIASLQRAVSLLPGLTRPLAWLAHAYAVAGQTDMARRLMDELTAPTQRDSVSPYDIAVIHAALGETSRAFAWLEKAYQARAWDLVQLKVDKRFDRLRGDLRFIELVRRVGSQDGRKGDVSPGQ